MNGSSRRGVTRGSNRGRREISVSSVLLRVALMAGGAGALFSGQASAQCAQPDANTFTCGGSLPNGQIFLLPFASSPDHIVVKDVTSGQITPGPLGTSTFGGIAVFRGSTDPDNLVVTLDKSVDIKAFASSVQTSAVQVIDSHSATPGSPLVTQGVNLAFDGKIDFDTRFVAPTRGVFTAIFRLLGVQNRTQAVNLAREGVPEA